MKSYFGLSVIGAVLGALLLLMACNTDDPVGTQVTELKFQTIADSLRTAGYDHLEISITKSDATDSASLFKTALEAGTPIVVALPDSYGKTYRIVVTATKSSEPGLVFLKTYVIAEGVVSGKTIRIIPATGPVDPNGPTGPTGPTGPSDAPTGVTIQPGAASLADAGTDSVRLTALVTPYPNAKQKVIWSSSDATIASVDSSGWVRSGLVGKATITAKADADPSKSAAIEVTVSKLLKAEKVVLAPQTLKIYTGMPAAAIVPAMSPVGVSPLLSWHSTREDLASVSQDGKVTGLKAGTALIIAQYKGDASIADTCEVTVVYDPPVLDVGKDIAVDAGATVDFLPIKVTQEFGGVVEFKWSLDGDTLWDSTSTSIPAALSRKYPVAGDFTARFSVKDQEGNTGTAKRLIQVGSNKPLVSIDSPKDGAYVNANPVTVEYKVNNVAFTRKVTLPREGQDTIVIDTTINGVKGSASAKVILDTKKPEVKIGSPVAGTWFKQALVTVAWKVDGKDQTTRLQDTLKVEGENLIVREAIDSAGNRGADTVRVKLDTKKPVIVISSPAPGTVTNKTTIDVVWTVDGVKQTTQLTEDLPVNGDNIIKRSFTDSAGNKDTAAVTIKRDNSAANVVITSPTGGTITNKTTIDVAWTIDGIKQTTGLTADLTVEGENTITRTGTNALGNSGSTSVKVTRDTQKPVIAITSPANGSTVTSTTVNVVWTVDGQSQSTETSQTLTAGDGEKEITRSNTDKAGNIGTITIKVILDKDKPAAPVMNASGTTASPSNGASGLTWKWTSGGNGNGKYRYWLNSATMPASPTAVTGGSATLTTGLVEGVNTLYVQENDDQGNWSPAANWPITLDKTGPTIAIDQAAQTVTNAAFTISAAVSDGSGIASVDVNGAASGTGSMTLASGKYSKQVTLAAGANTLVVTAKDNLGNSKTAQVVITFDKPTITITYPPDGFVTSNGAITIKYDYKVGSTVTAKTKPLTLGDGASLQTISEAGADSKSVQLYVLSNVIFVRGNAPAGGDGTSWDKAYKEITSAVVDSRATNGNKIWVSAATYWGLASDNGLIWLPAGVSLYGGFAGSPARPFTEAGRDFKANETILSTPPGVDFGGMIDMEGSSTVDGFTFQQNILGAESVIANAPAGAVNTLRNCIFHSTKDLNSVVYSNANMNVDKSTFESTISTGSVLTIFGGTMNITGSTIQNNRCQSVVFVDGTLNVSSSTIKGNQPYSSGSPAPKIDVQNGGFFDKGGNTLSFP